MSRSVSIIVPTYCEAENLPYLLQRIAESLNPTDLDWNVIVVDDNSPDNTINVCDVLSKQHPLQLIVRKNQRGLSTAVIAGMQVANSDYLLCIDADLSHPPESIPAMIEQLSECGGDFVIGSRYVQGGSTDDDWGLFRWLNSVVATGLAKPLTRAKDPMAGFFALKNSDFQGAVSSLDPVGYKIGLELIVKCGCKNVREVAIHFADRQYGESKLSLKEQLNYIRHLGKLYAYRWPNVATFCKFGMVGLTGVGVNMLALAALLQISVIPPLAMALAIWVAMSWNFLLNREFTFRDNKSVNVASEYIRFCLASLTGAVLNWSVATLLWSTVSYFTEAPAFAGFVGVLAGMFANFTLCKRFVFFGTTNQSIDQEQKPSDVSVAAGQQVVLETK